MCKTQFSIFVSVVLFISSNAVLIRRSDWGAKPAKVTPTIAGPVSYVLIHHSASPACSTTEKCKASMRSLQSYHMNTRHWSDIGYNFAVGGDGNIYEGCGFNVMGSHSPGYNAKSIGIVFIGNYQDTRPPSNMIEAAKKFISEAYISNKLQSGYKLIGHRQVRSTLCPGTALFNEIKTWPHWSAKP